MLAAAVRTEVVTNVVGMELAVARTAEAVLGMDRYWVVRKAAAVVDNLER